MEWSNEIPAESGLFVFRASENDTPKVLIVTVDDDTETVTYRDPQSPVGPYYPDEENPGQWIGPLPA